MDAYIGNIDHGFGLDTNGKYISINIYFAGCSKEPKCEGCHNPELWDRENGRRMPISDIIEIINSDAMSGALVLMGGEPLDQEEAVLELAKYANDKGIKVFLYTGKELEEVSEEIKRAIDVIISGPYIPSMANPNGSWPPSTNQVITRR